MSLKSVQEIAENLLPITELADYLQLQADASGAVRQDNVLVFTLRVALDWINNKTNLYVLRQKFEIRLPFSQTLRLDFGKNEGFVLSHFTHLDLQKTEHEIVDYQLDIQQSCTEIKWNSENSGGEIILSFYLGSASWELVKPDLRFATIILGAHFYEQRNDKSLGNIEFPKLVNALIEKYRIIKISGSTR